MKYQFIIISLFMLFSCHSPQSAAKEQLVEFTAAGAAEPEILFLQLKVWKQKDGIYGAEMENKQQVKGVLNSDLRGVQASEGEWLVTFLDAKKKMVSQVVILNPLEEHYEVSDDKGQLRPVEVKKEEAQCFIRVQYEPRFSALQFEQIINSKERIPLFSINL